MASGLGFRFRGWGLSAWVIFVIWARAFEGAAPEKPWKLTKQTQEASILGCAA